MTLVFRAARSPLAAQAAAARVRSTRERRFGLAIGELFLVERLSVHVRGRIETEEAEHGGRDVGERRILAVDLPAGEEHSRHQPRVDAVIAAPGLHVVLEDRARDDARGAIPGSAVAGVEADD